MGVDERDGSVWVVEGEHPQARGSAAQIIVISPDAQVRRQVKLGEGRVAVDPTRDTVWFAARGELKKLNARGEQFASFPVRAFSLDVEPDTGYVWLAGDQGVWRIDRDGKPVWEHLTPGGSQKWLAVLPDLKD